MVALVKRVYEPGAKFDWMPIFEGAQGIGKSSFGRLLVGDQWFLDHLPDLSDKDAMQVLQGIWLIEMGELSQLRRNEMEAVKAFLTKTNDKYRPSHGRKTGEFPRRCVFFGTTNQDTYLKDETGNRRFKPIKVGQLNFKALRTERLQLFAEAVVIHKMGLETELSLNIMEGSEAALFERQMHAQKTIKDDSEVMRELLRDFTKSETDFPFKKFKLVWLFLGWTGTDLDRTPLRKFTPNNRNLQFSAKALKFLGAKKSLHESGSWWSWAPKSTKRGQK